MIHGVINIHKEKGFTSHDVVAKLRGILGQKKIGHTGTLDPDATGVLPVCLGKATKLCDMLTDRDKEYEAHMILGFVTDTQDTTGQILEKHEVTCTEEEVREAIYSFLGEYMQVPPMNSALKVDGKKLYELAREGKVIERKARPVTFYELEILSMELPRVRIRVTCSKGTYIRTLCHDIGKKLGCGGCMEELLRTYVEPFALETSLTLAQIQQLADEGRVEEILCPVEHLFADMPACTIRPEFSKYMYNGNPLKASWVEMQDAADSKVTASEIRLYTEQNVFFGIYEYQQDRRQYKLKKMFYGG